MNAEPETRVALVSGATRGLGRETARVLAKRGYEVWAGARDPEAGESEAGSIGARPVRLDVTDPASIEEAAAAVGRESGRLDVLVNNAGIAIDGDQRPATADMDKVEQTMQTNVFGAWRLTIACAPMLRGAQSGRIVNVSSGMGGIAEMGSGWAPAYRVSKAALNALTRALAFDLTDAGVLVNAVCPGWVRTDLGGSGARLSVEEGTEGIIWAATLPDDGPTGGFFRHGEPLAW